MKSASVILLTILMIFTGASQASDKAEESGAPLRHETYQAPSTPEVTAKLVVNIPARKVQLYNDGQLVYAFPVAVGTNQYKTPTGPRALRQIIWNPWWIPPPDSAWAKDAKRTPPGPGNPLGIVKLDLGGAILMHGTNKEYTVGTVASHGCMRMHKEDVKKLAWWIQSHYTTKNDPALLKEYAKNGSTSYYVNLPRPVPVTIEYEVVQVDRKMVMANPDVYGRGGNLKKKVYEAIQEQGYDTERVDDFALEKLLQKSQSQSIQMPLKELMPGKLKPSKEHLPDPVEITWKNRKPGKLSFLFTPRFL